MRGIFRSSIVALAALLALPAANAHAALIEQNLFAAGDKLLTLDDATGLEWLDLSLNIGRNYNSVSADLANGGVYAGFRYATRTEYETLWAGTSFDHNYWTSSTPVGDVDEVQRAALIGELLGYTYDTVALGSCVMSNSNRCYRENMGMLADTNGGNHWLTHMDFFDTLQDSTSYVAGRSYWNSSFGNPNFVEGSNAYFDQRVSSWLVRDFAAVPVPAAFPLLAGGLGLLGFASRRRRKTA